MRIVTPLEMREMDARATSEFLIPEEILMERAGMAVSSACREILGASSQVSRRIVALAGPGHNGADALVALRDLASRGYPAEAILLSSDVRGGTASARECSRLERMGVSVIFWSDPGARHRVSHAALVIDGLFGTGFRGEGPAGGAREMIEATNRAGASGVPVICVDIPSGVDGLTGAVPGVAIRGLRTVTFGAPKWGLLCDPGTRYAGEIYLSLIGFPRALLAGGNLSCLISAEARELIPPRSPSVHKGEAGHVLIAGGSSGKTGAVILAARGALRAGSGLVTVLWDRAFGECALSLPEVMTMAVDAGSLSPGTVLEATMRMDAVACGPGGEEGEVGRRLVEALLSDYPGPLVGDASLFTLFAGTPERIASLRKGPLVLTPHPGELGRLLGRETARILSEPLAAAREGAERTGAVLLLKGARTHVVGPEGQTSLNLTGDPVMAGAGMGDVLTGVIASLLGQGLAPFDAARLGAFVHGLAGERLARGATRGRLASELADHLPGVLFDLSSGAASSAGQLAPPDPALFWPFGGGRG